MNEKNLFLRGTLLLTFAGLVSRIMGFFYRIFLANTIGAEGIGIYQLIFPIYSVCFSLCASGIETAISKLTAAKFAIGKPQEASAVLKAGLTLTVTLSLSCSLLIFRYADVLANVFLKEPRCAELLKILAFAIPFGTSHSCIFGYYFGTHKAGIPSAAQLVEQLCRISCVFLLCRIYKANDMAISPAIAVIGLVCGEFCASLFTLTCFYAQTDQTTHFPFFRLIPFVKEIITLSAPLTGSRMCINVLTSLEAAMIPTALKAYGMETSAALSIYGILNGMALPLILFPNALTVSLSTMLLPTVSELQAGGRTDALKTALRKTFTFCLLLGGGSLFLFFTFGKTLGTILFSNDAVGDFITVLSWICPFLYLNTTLGAVLNGLGRTDASFFNGIGGLFLRIGFIFFGIPRLGIHGYLFGLLASQLFTTFSSCLFLQNTMRT